MDADRVADAMRRFVLAPSEQVQRRWDVPGSVTLQTRRFAYEARPAEWSIASEPWVADAVRVLADSGDASFMPTFGLLFTTDDDVLFLNSVETMQQVGQQLSNGLDPLAYAEVLAELHYPMAAEDRSVARPSTPGYLIRDPQAFTDQFPFVDPELPRSPQVNGDASEWMIAFRSYIRYLVVDYGSALDIYDWTVTAARGEPATWSCTYAARRLEIPWHRTS